VQAAFCWEALAHCPLDGSQKRLAAQSNPLLHFCPADWPKADCQVKLPEPRLVQTRFQAQLLVPLQACPELSLDWQVPLPLFLAQYNPEAQTLVTSSQEPPEATTDPLQVEEQVVVSAHGFELT